MPIAWGEITAKQVLSPINGTWVSGRQETILSGISTDSRTIRPGELFWALCGDRYDGHNFVEEAVGKEAAGVVVQEDHWRKAQGGENEHIDIQSGDPVVIMVDNTLRSLGDLAKWWRQRHSVKVVGITGSTGKTTTKEMAAGILDLGYRTLKNHGNLNNLIGMPLTLLRLEQDHRNAVLEMGMNRPGEIARLTEIADPDVGVITNVGMAHLEGVTDLEGVVRAKTELIEKISPLGRVIVNGDDELLVKACSLFQKELVTFGTMTSNDLMAYNIQNLGREGLSFDFRYQGDFWTVRLKTPGAQNVFNGLAAAAIAFCLNEPLEHILEGLHHFSGVEGRFMVTSLAGDIVMVDDTYNANPSSLRMALESIKSMVDQGGRIIVGLGEMMELGDASTPAHLEAGRMVADLCAQYFVAMGGHADEMVKGALESGMSQNRVYVAETHEEMASKIMDEIRERDLVFLKGSRRIGLEKVVERIKLSLT